MSTASFEPTLEATQHLVGRCAAGEQSAWRELHRRYHPIACAFLRRMGVKPTGVDDACQDVFVRVFRYLPNFRGEAEFKTWLYRLCITEARKARRREAVQTLLGRLIAREDAPHSTGLFNESDANRTIQRGLDALAEPERAVFIMYELEGLKGKRVAEILRCPEATVFRRLHYARKRFAEAVAPHAAGEAR